MKSILYYLIDDGGVNTIELPILLPLGERFRHEFGKYEVREITHRDPENYFAEVHCERISKEGLIL